MLDEIISLDAFLRPCMVDYATLSSIYEVIRQAYSKKVYVDKALQRKYEQVKMVDSELGVIPEGWEVVQLENRLLQEVYLRNRQFD